MVTSEFTTFYKSIAKEVTHFNHEVVMEGDEPTLLYEGERKKWSELKEIFKGAVKSLPHGFRYGEKGIEHHDWIHWQKLRPSFVDRTAQEGKYYFELVVRRNLFYHCFTRLIDDKGQVISVGFCAKTPLFLPLRARKGKIVSPDPDEYDDSVVKSTTRIEISKEDYLKLITKIENDQKSENYYFHIINRNCSKYACELLEEIDIHVPNKELITQAFYRKVCDLLHIRLPLCVLKVIHFVSCCFYCLLAFFLNLGMILFGGYLYMDKDIKKILKEHKMALPRMNLFSLENLKFASGWRLAEWQRCFNTVQKEHPDWSAKLIAQSLEGLNFNIADLQAQIATD